MPLIHSSSRAAVSDNIRREISAGKPQKQAVAIALDVQRRSRAAGGIVARQDGGGITGMAAGGLMSLSSADPGWARNEESASTRAPTLGFLHGPTPGRADSVQTTSPGGAYVLPADVIAGMGEGNSLAGAHVAEMMFGTGPHGIPMPRGARGRGPPSAPRMAVAEATGGTVRQDPGQTDVLLSDGEYVVHPAVVRQIGRGNLKRGHKILDAFVLQQRAKHIKTLKKLPGPVKTK